MDFHVFLAVVAGLVGISAVVPYIRDMLKGSTRPNLVSWSLWLVIQGIYAAAQWSSGASFSIILPLVGMLAVASVVVLGLFGYGYKKYGPLDFICLALAFGAIVLWQVTNNPVFALAMAVAADFMASLPTMAKAYKDPKSETAMAYILAMVAAVLGGFSSTVFDFANIFWPVYMFSANALIIALILLGKKRR